MRPSPATGPATARRLARALAPVTLALVLMAATGCDGLVLGGGITVAFVNPASGDQVDNPVRFEIVAHGVDQVEIVVDGETSLGAWDPATRDHLLYRFAGTDVARSVRLIGRRDGVEVASDVLEITVSADSCEERFFVTEFAKRNEDPSGVLDLTEIRETSLAAISAEVADLQACGAGVTLGGIMSLLLYEGGFRAAAFNTRCAENSYNRTESGCDADPEALYSYQYGIGAIHMSNFHPCKGGEYTDRMRAGLLEEAAAAGFPVGDDLVTSAQGARFAEICPGDQPNAVDHYILGAHDVYEVPRNSYGNALDSYRVFPLFSPEVSIRMTFRELLNACASMDSDRAAIVAFGGADTSYAGAGKQAEILSYYQDFAAANCQ